MELSFGDTEQITLTFSDKNERVIGHLIKITVGNCEEIADYLSQDLLTSIDAGLISDTGAGRISGPAKDIALLLKFSDAFSGEISFFDFQPSDFEKSDSLIALADGLIERIHDFEEAEISFRELFGQEQWHSIVEKLHGYVKFLPPAFAVVTFENII